MEQTTNFKFNKPSTSSDKITDDKLWKENWDKLDGHLAEKVNQLKNRKVFDLGLYSGDTTTDMVDLIHQKITEGYTRFLMPPDITFNKELTILDRDHGVYFEGTIPLFVQDAPQKATIHLNTGGVGIRISGSNNVVFKDIAFNTYNNSKKTLTNPSTVAIVQQRSTLHDYCQWFNFDNVSINMHNDPTANNGKGTIGIYNDTSELGVYNNLTVMADIPVVLTRDNIYGIANAHRSSSLKCTTFSGITTLLASNGHAMVWDAVSTVTFENLYVSKNLARGTNTQNYAILATGQAVNGYQNYNIQMLNYDCEVFEGSFLLTGTLESSTIVGHHHKIASGIEVISVKENARITQTEFKIFNAVNSTGAVFNLIKAYDTSFNPAIDNVQVHFLNSNYQISVAKSVDNLLIYSKHRAKIEYPSTPIAGMEYKITNITRQGFVHNGSLISFSSTKPTDTTNYLKGDVIYNSNPSVGNAFGWQFDGTTWNEIGQYGYRTAPSTPVGSLTPRFMGERFFDSNDKNWYVGVGTTNSDWKIGNLTYRSGTASPLTVVTPRYIGEEYLDTSNKHWYKAVGTTNADWKQTTV